MYAISKRKDMVLSDFLSRQNNHEIIPILFNVYQVLHENYYSTDNYLVQTRSQARFSGIKLPEVHCMGKNLDPNIKPGKTTCQSHKRQYREAMHRSGYSKIEKEKN